ncbi:Putative heterokaryon incompatibility [Septoria linicola]|uniref:Heterokaryon incompatibility n=1 Tax=Septoria linicola TaxID=215465 RepID=A0A9Q9AYF9_9PEZI|nr:Putative heterokaryon incompatibility [Septoria linicola]
MAQVKGTVSALCDTCRSLDFEVMAKPVEGIRYDGKAYDTRMQVHCRSFAALVQSAKTCDLCALIMEAYVQSESNKRSYHDLEGEEFVQRVHERDHDEDAEYADPSKHVWQIGLSGGNGTCENLYADVWPVAPSKWKPINWPPPGIKQLLGAFVVQGRVLTDKTRSLGLFGFHIGRISRLDSDVNVSTGSESGWVRIATEAGGPSFIGKSGRWVALSYCWGGAPPLTTAATYERNLESLPLKELPQLFQDAIQIVRELGLKWLWIDTLCIIQGDKADWERECGRMRTVYEHSALTLSAPAASSPDGTFLHSRPSTPQCWFRFRDHTLSAAIPSICPSSIDQGVPKQENSVLSQRGWVLQERLLAPRILYFGEDQMYMECRTADRFETLASDMPTDWANGPVSKSLFNEAGITPNPSEAGINTRELWRRLVKTFCTCDLTGPMDRLPALSGLAQRMALELQQDTYLAGLWSGGLVKDLAWFRDPHSQMSKKPAVPEYRAPSWSWAAQDMEVHFDDHVILSEDGHETFEVIESQVSSVGLDSFGQVSEGRLKVKARVMALELIPASHRAGSDTSNFAVPSDLADYWPDDQSLWSSNNVPWSEKITAPCILLRAACTGKTSCSCSGLALEEVGGQPGVYRRIGYIRDSSWKFDSRTTGWLRTSKLKEWLEIERTTLTLI